MTWVAWRLQRTETLVAFGILALLAAFLVPTGIQMANAYHSDGLAACLSVPPGPTCDAGDFRQRFQSLLDLGAWFTFVPGLVGAILAAPFILDLERGTYRLAWTQSITRGRWIVGKLGTAIASAALAGGVLALLLNWWHSPGATIDGRLIRSTYDSAGIVPVGYTLFALGLALAVGAIWRRTAASVVVAFVGYFTVRVLVDYWLRDHLVTPVHATYRGASQPAFFDNAHIISLVGTIHGRQVMSGGGFFGGGLKVAAPDLRNAVFHVVYQPASDFWPLQLRETALFVGVAAILVVFAAWWTKRRAA